MNKLQRIVLADLHKQLETLHAQVAAATDKVYPLKSVLAGKLEDIRVQVEEIREEEQEKFDNMPEGLQNGPTGQGITDAISALEETEEELRNVVQMLEDDTAESTGNFWKQVGEQLQDALSQLREI